MAMNCFDIESCVNAFLDLSSAHLQKEDEQDKRNSGFGCWGRKSCISSGPGHGGASWLGGECRCVSVSCEVWRPLPNHFCSGLSPWPQALGWPCCYQKSWRIFSPRGSSPWVLKHCCCMVNSSMTDFEWFCVEPGGELSGPCGSLPIQGALWFMDHSLLGFFSSVSETPGRIMRCSIKAERPSRQHFHAKIHTLCGTPGRLPCACGSSMPQRSAHAKTKGK